MMAAQCVDVTVSRCMFKPTSESNVCEIFIKNRFFAACKSVVFFATEKKPFHIRKILELTFVQMCFCLAASVWCCGESSGEMGLVDRWGFIMFTKFCYLWRHSMEFPWIKLKLNGAFAWFMRLCPWLWLLTLTAAVSTESRLVMKLSCSRGYVTQESVGILMESGPHASVCLWGFDSMTRARFGGSIHGRVPSRFRFHDLFVRKAAEAPWKTLSWKTEENGPIRTESCLIREAWFGSCLTETSPMLNEKVWLNKIDLFLFCLITFVLTSQLTWVY